jgi:hypothetical protein
MKTFKMSFWGGYHNVKPITLGFKATYDTLEDVIKMNSHSTDYGVEDFLSDHLSDGQRRKLENHFCCINGCTCGGYHRDLEFEFASYPLDVDDVTDMADFADYINQYEEYPAANADLLIERLGCKIPTNCEDDTIICITPDGEAMYIDDEGKCSFIPDYEKENPELKYMKF